jgi:hypothetical protein
VRRIGCSDGDFDDAANDPVTDLEPQDPYHGQPAPAPFYAPQYGYPPPYGQPPQYGPAPQWGYPPPQYPVGYPYGYPYPPAPPPIIGRRRPGTTTAAAVLGWVTAGLLVIAATVLLAGSSATADLGNTFGVDTSWASEFVVDGVVNLVCAGLLVVGGIWLAERKPAGQLMLTVANMVIAADAVYWTVRFNSYAALIPSAVVFGALAVVGAALTWTADTRTWLVPEKPAPTTLPGR